MKIGIYGGTFDPIHIAHLIIAERARYELNLDFLYFVPSYIPPHKTEKNISSSEHRLHMVKIAVADNPHLKVSDYEVSKKGTSYTVDTLKYFSQEYQLKPEELFLIMGADNLQDFDQWKNPEVIQSISQLVVAGRPQNNKAHTPNFPAIQLNSPLLEISATAIRERVKKGRSIRYLVPLEVENYIKMFKLYTSN